jgi:hypothetical protein
MPRYLAALDAGDPALGGKARSLGRLRAAGLLTPRGFAVTDELFRALRAGGPPLPADLAGALAALDAAVAALDAAPLPPGFTDALAAQLADLGGARFSVRSSFAGEDEAGALGPGVYRSCVDVPAAAVVDAVRAVLRSALTPGALAYALAHGRPPAAPPVAVLIHRHVAADAAGGAARDGAAVISARHGVLTPAARSRIEAALQRLGDGVEVEWAARGDEVTFLQLRPYRAPAPAAAWPGDPGPPWRWDAAHNPLPLSPAQSGLVALVDERCRTGLRQRVIGGYLFHAADPGWVPPAVAPVEALAALRARAEARLAALGSAPPLEDALALFLEVYEPLFGAIQPAARAARRALATFVERHAPEARLSDLLAGVESMASERRRRAGRLVTAEGSDRATALADYLTLFGDEAPAWDVAVPTYRETPDALTPTAGPLAAAPPDPAPLPPALRAAGDPLLADARAAVSVGEDDDWLYARVQTAVRRALLALGQRLEASGALAAAEDIFFWPLPTVRAVAAGAPPPDDGQALAQAGGGGAGGFLKIIYNHTK